MPPDVSHHDSAARKVRSLSVCCMTAGPAARVAASLGLLRPVADELVVALDDRADAETEGALAAVADVVVRYRYAEPVDRPLRWLFGLCRGDWILNVDDDELPSAALLARLPELLAADDVTHYWIRRPWLWPERDRVIDEHPWRDDYQLRLVVNDPRLLRFPSETHRPIEALGPHRYVREPLYHLDALLNPLDRREAKARRYEALRPGKRVGGGPMNHVLHLPERRAGLRTEQLPPEDARAVEAVLTAPAPPPVASSAPTVDAAVIDAAWAGRAFADGDYRAEIELIDEPDRLRASEQRRFEVAVANRGSATWPWGERGEPEVRLAYRWLSADGDAVEHGVRTALPADLGPGERQVVPLHVVAPARPGTYRLQVDLVHEHVRWFRCDAERTVEVERRLRVSLVGDDEAVADALERLAEEHPEVEPLVLRSAPPPRYGPPTAPDLRRYLLDGTVHGRLRDVWPLAARTAALLRAARQLRLGSPARPLLRGGQEFLEEVAASSHLLLLAGRPPAGTRELWLQYATVAAARELEVEVLVERGAPAVGHGPLGARLTRGIAARSRTVEPGALAIA